MWGVGSNTTMMTVVTMLWLPPLGEKHGRYLIPDPHSSARKVHFPFLAQEDAETERSGNLLKDTVCKWRKLLVIRCCRDHICSSLPLCLEALGHRTPCLRHRVSQAPSSDSWCGYSPPWTPCSLPFLCSGITQSLEFGLQGGPRWKNTIRVPRKGKRSQEERKPLIYHSWLHCKRSAKFTHKKINLQIMLWLIKQ